ncbi:hypothetical protein F5X96DRAFT_631252 [Biscogniauxia mediterranea]|nr:hypothetical protein F5X96DRAFT_631252 [Biscogniauxia mediterranea]
MKHGLPFKIGLFHCPSNDDLTHVYISFVFLVSIPFPSLSLLHPPNPLNIPGRDPCVISIFPVFLLALRLRLSLLSPSFSFLLFFSVCILFFASFRSFRPYYTVEMYNKHG